MKLTFGGSTSGNGGCPTVFRTERGTIVIQGTTVTDPEALAEMSLHGNGIPSYESAVEVPAELLRFIDIEVLPEVALDPARREFTIDAPIPPEVARA